MKPEEKLGICYLKEIYNYYEDQKNITHHVQKVEWKYVNGVFNALGIGIEPTIQYLMGSSTSFDDFESWIIQNGRISKNSIAYFNSIVLREKDENQEPTEKVFDDDDLKKWNNEGYVILHDAISKEDCQKSVQYICKEIGADLDDKTTWYSLHPLKQGIMVQLFNAPILDKNRFSKKIKMAFE